MAKERDNTWLQLQICPDIWRQKEDKGPLLECPEKAECRLIYAHPNKHVLDQSLASGYVVSCQAFVFSTYGANDGTMSRPPCTRVKCKYYHPPKALGLVVINSGRNNKRIKQQQEAINKMKAVQQQQQQLWAATAAATLPAINSGVNLGAALNPYSINPFLYPQAFFAPPYAFQPQRPTVQAAPSTSTLEPPASALLLRKRARSPSQKGDANENTISPEVKRRSKELVENSAGTLGLVNTGVTSPAVTLPSTSAASNVILYSYPHYLQQ